MRLPTVKRRKEIELLFSTEQRTKGSYLEIRRTLNEGDARFLFVISKKCGNAPRRNRTRRILREWLRKNYNKFQAGNIWMIRVSPETKCVSYNKLSITLRRELVELLGKLIEKDIDVEV